MMHITSIALKTSTATEERTFVITLVFKSFQMYILNTNIQ